MLAPELQRNRADGKMSSYEILGHCVDKLETLARTLQTGGQQQQGRMHFTSLALVNAVLGSSLLKNMTNLPTMLERAIALISAPAMRGGLHAHPNDTANHVIPSHATIYHSRFSLDCAYAVLTREFPNPLERNLVVCCWADSSPMGKRTWLMMIVHYTESKDIISVAASVDEVIAMADVAEDRPFQAVENTHIVCNGFHAHNLVPSAMGGKAESLEDKASALLHSISLEQHSALHVDAFCKCIDVFTVDMGTEIGLSDCVNPGWAHLGGGSRRWRGPAKRQHRHAHVCPQHADCGGAAHC